MASSGTVGDCSDNSMTGSFWSSMQIEQLNRKKWRTRLDLTNAIFEDIEIFYNRTAAAQSSTMPLRSSTSDASQQHPFSA